MVSVKALSLPRDLLLAIADFYTVDELVLVLGLSMEDLVFILEPQILDSLPEVLDEMQYEVPNDE